MANQQNKCPRNSWLPHFELATTHMILPCPAAQLSNRSIFFHSHFQQEIADLYCLQSPKYSQNLIITGWWFEPLWKIWKSMGMMKFPIYGKIKNVPKPPTSNHCLAYKIWSFRICHKVSPTRLSLRRTSQPRSWSLTSENSESPCVMLKNPPCFADLTTRFTIHGCFGGEKSSILDDQILLHSNLSMAKFI